MVGHVGHMEQLFSLASLEGLILGYMFGAIPFGLLLSRLFGLGDVRQIGSGNIGATNVLRTGNKAAAAATLILDILKGTAPVLLAYNWLGTAAALAGGFGAFLGHLYPIWLKFKGGKGVATYIGVLLGLAWPVALLFCLIWLGVALFTRYSSLSALLASLTAPILLYAWEAPAAAFLALLMTLLLYFKHRGNISRLLAGTEAKIGFKKAEE